MILFENTEVMNVKNALRGMRNPMKSWEKSDTHHCDEDCPHVLMNTDPVMCHNGEYDFCIGKNDMKLAKSLRAAGSDHRKYLRQIFVSVDITSSFYFWKEFDTYKIGTVANSTSTMHKIHTKEFELDDFSHEHLIDVDESMKTVFIEDNPMVMMESIVICLNNCREMYLETKDKKWWWQMIQLLPSSYNQKRTVTLNYEVLVNMYHARKHHKLDEWRELCSWIESLPYAKELIIGE